MSARHQGRRFGCPRRVAEYGCFARTGLLNRQICEVELDILIGFLFSCLCQVQLYSHVQKHNETLKMLLLQYLAAPEAVHGESKPATTVCILFGTGVSCASLTKQEAFLLLVRPSGPRLQ